MTALVIGELTADASTIILMGTGPEHEVAQAAAKLQTLTPLIKPTDPAGALQLPATWPAVVQLATTFGAAWRPGPRLANWIAAEVERRHHRRAGRARRLRPRRPAPVAARARRLRAPALALVRRRRR